jgi:hypothetical protein
MGTGGREMKIVWRVLLLLLVVVLVVGGIVGWNRYQEVRAEYDAYRALIQQGITIAGVAVGWHTPTEAREKVWSWVAEPYYRDFTVYYQDEALPLSTGDDLAFEIPVDEMVDEAVAASHQYDYWDGFKLWVQDQAETLDLDIPLRMDFDETAAERYLSGVAETYDITPVEPMLDVKELTFYPGSPGRRMDVASPAARINEMVPHPEQREIVLPVSIVEPDQSRGRIESMLSTLVPVMARAPIPPSFYTATLPISTTGGIEGTPTVSYTGEVTWTFPHFVGYTGQLTSTYGFFFDPGEPGYTFKLEEAVQQVEIALDVGLTTPITFEPELVPPPPITAGLLISPLQTLLEKFPGVVSILVKDLGSSEVVYEAGMDYVLSGMSLVKVGIMVEVYRYFGGEIDAQTHQELFDMLGSESCNPCANRLLAAVGGGSAKVGAQKVTQTMRRLGLANFYLCGPFRVVELWGDEGQVLWTANTASALWFVQDKKTPRWDPCVKATPHEMANLVEMIYQCTQDKGLLRDAYPSIFSPQVCEDMVDIMAANDLRNMLGAGIPAEVKIAHKHGFAGYDVPWGDTRAEVGIIFGPEATYLVAFYIWDDTPWLNYGVVQPLYRDVSNMLYNYFNPHEPFWPRPPWTPPPEEEEMGESDA